MGQDGGRRGGGGCATNAILLMMKTVGRPSNEDDLTITDSGQLGVCGGKWRVSKGGEGRGEGGAGGGGVSATKVIPLMEKVGQLTMMTWKDAVGNGTVDDSARGGSGQQ